MGKTDTFLQLNQVILGIVAIGVSFYFWKKRGNTN